jgi:hypothetical protein
LFILAVTTLLCLLGLEGVVRVLSRTDLDGETRFRFTRLKPYRLPVRHAERDIGTYLASQDSTMIYDPELGWSQRPGVVGHNTAGFITSGPAPERVPSPDRLRIALFGDSFTQGTYENGWWRVLEAQLNASGLKCEVLNFGVGGYGMDQAYMRWQRDGKPWQPQVVVMGFFAEDCYRNVNLLRLLRDPDSGIPFMKPRFVTEGEGLRLVNSPTPNPAQVPAIVRDFESWPLRSQEHFFCAADFRLNSWRWSRLAALVEAKMALVGEASRAAEFFRPDGEATKLALRIVRQMRTEVEASGAKFYVAHLPGKADLEALRQTGRFRYEPLYTALKAENAVIALEPALQAAAGARKYEDFFYDGHYRAEFEAVIGKEMASALRVAAKTGNR